MPRKSTLSCNSFTALRRICSPQTRWRLFTIGFWTNSTVWPVKVSTADQSAIGHLAIGETLTYNQRMSITAP